MNLKCNLIQLEGVWGGIKKQEKSVFLIGFFV